MSLAVSLCLEIMLSLDGHIAVLSLEDISSIALSNGLHLRHTVSWEVIVPASVADMLLSHHTIPFAPCDIVIICSTEQ